MRIPEKLIRPCERVRRECLWEYTFTEAEIFAMARKGTNREQMFLFSKLIENSTDILDDLSLFSPGDQQKLILGYKVPAFNCSFLNKRHKILQYFINNEDIDIPELRWNT
jgi:hypothetical protein